MSPRRVTLLSDFGTADGYAATMAGVIAAAAPSAAIDHASHQIPAGDLLSAALTLSRYAFLYPEGSVHLVVVDPGVGTHRRAIAASVDGRYFVAPDNGVLTRVLSRGGPHELVELDAAIVGTGEPVSATFHGRDLFAPAAGRLARGEPLSELGSPVTDPVLLPLPEPLRADDRVTGEVIQVDRFGNLVTNVPGAWVTELGPAALIRVGRDPGAVVGRLRRTYADVAPGELVALIGSLGLLEISVRDGRADARLGAGREAPVEVTLQAPPGAPA